MANASESLKTFATRRFLVGCGSCTYIYSKEDGCYQRTSNGCTSDCTCPPLICGVTAQVMKLMHPGSVTSAEPVLWCCTPEEDEPAQAYVLFGLLLALAAALTFWRRVALVMGIVCLLLFGGMVFALLR
jgi:hypothetical protein